MHLVLASSSVYRKSLLERLGLEFECCSPNVDEKLLDHLSLEENVQDIALRKARAVVEQYPGSLIIASDQLCSINSEVLGKPHDHKNAREQLVKASGQTVIFNTSLVVYNASNDQILTHCDETSVVFRRLTETEILRYLDREKPYDCAGSFKVESLGVSLFEKVINQDPTALIGLPLIALCHMLRKNGIAV